MAFSQFEKHRYEKEAGAFVERHRPPPHIRPELDVGFRLENQSVLIFEVRPGWDAPLETMEHPVAKATYVKKGNLWKIYWQRADLKWHRYEPAPTAVLLEEFLRS